MSDLICKNCRYFAPGVKDCRRHPPKVVIWRKDYSTVFPAVKEHWSCGEGEWHNTDIDDLDSLIHREMGKK